MNSVITSLSNNIFTITLNRPEARNSMTFGMIEELIKVFTEFQKNEARVAVIKGAGDKAFCAGADLKELHSCNPAEKKKFFKKLATLITLIGRVTKPTISSVRGFALAGGCGLAASTDIVFASEDSKFGLPEINIGLVPLVVMAPVYRAVGTRALSQLVLSGQAIDARESLRIGLVSKVVSANELYNETNKLAGEIASRSPAALECAKKALRDVASKNYFSTIQDYARRMESLCTGHEALEGVSAFLEKRSPDWSKKLK